MHEFQLACCLYKLICMHYDMYILYFHGSETFLFPLCSHVQISLGCPVADTEHCYDFRTPQTRNLMLYPLGDSFVFM
jgi:hypothetical protein